MDSSFVKCQCSSVFMHICPLSADPGKVSAVGGQPALSQPLRLSGGAAGCPGVVWTATKCQGGFEGELGSKWSKQICSLFPVSQCSISHLLQSKHCSFVSFRLHAVAFSCHWCWHVVVWGCSCSPLCVRRAGEAPPMETLWRTSSVTLLLHWLITAAEAFRYCRTLLLSRTSECSIMYEGTEERRYENTELPQNNTDCVFYFLFLLNKMPRNQFKVREKRFKTELTNPGVWDITPCLFFVFFGLTPPFLQLDHMILDCDWLSKLGPGN